MCDDENRRMVAGRRPGVVCGVLLVFGLLVALPFVGATAAETGHDDASQPTEPAFVVAIDADGSARTTLTVTFDLTTDSERRAFEVLRANTTARERRTRQFAAQMRTIAARAENESGREMAIRDPAIDFTEHNDTGIVALSVTWDGLAAQNGDRLVVREPFDSEFSLDRTFRIVGPDGYDLTSVAPSPTSQTKTTATWDDQVDFDRFEAVFTPQSTTGDDATATTQRETPADSGVTSGTPTTSPPNQTEGSASGPGFGVTIALFAALIGVALLALRADR